MTTKIDKPIVAFEVVALDDAAPAAPPAPEPPKKWVRPEVMHGQTWKINPPNSDHAIYVTVNYDEARPYEVFINTKNPEHHVWMMALTRMISAVLRKGGNYAFVVDELKGCFDPAGGYYLRGGKYMGSVVAHIGHILSLAFGTKEEVDPHVAEFIETKRQEVSAPQVPTDYPDNATLCSKCQTKAVVKMDGCEVCLSCGASHCN